MTTTPGKSFNRGPYLTNRDLLFRFDVHGLGVAVEHRHAYTGRVHLNCFIIEDLLRLPDHFHLFPGITVVLERIESGAGR